MRNYPTLAIGISIVILRGITNIEFVCLVEKLFRPRSLAWTDFVFSDPTYTDSALAGSVWQLKIFFFKLLQVDIFSTKCNDQ